MAGAHGGGAVNSGNLPIVVAHDGTFLGDLSCSSIGNRFSTFGSRFQPKSIWNRFGNYGSEFSLQSPYDEFTSTPPAVVLDGKIIAYLTVREVVGTTLDPRRLEAYMADRCNNEDGYRGDK